MKNLIIMKNLKFVTFFSVKCETIFLNCFLSQFFLACFLKRKFQLHKWKYINNQSSYYYNTINQFFSRTRMFLYVNLPLWILKHVFSHKKCPLIRIQILYFFLRFHAYSEIKCLFWFDKLFFCKVCQKLWLNQTYIN